jgi:DNA-binding transcriptional MerR regulator/methylmalonyl-CoA mutase cobalamin-binding subunit
VQTPVAAREKGGKPAREAPVAGVSERRRPRSAPCTKGGRHGRAGVPIAIVKPLRFPIRAVSKLTGIPVETLRAWERRYGVVEPDRDERGRVYSDVDVERLRLLRRAVEAGHAIGRVASLSSAHLRALLSEPPAEEPLPRAPDLRALTAAVERFDAGAFRRELSRLAAILPLRALCRDVALPLLRRVGEDWHAGRIGIAQEHMTSAEVRGLLGALARLHQVRRRGPTLVFGTPPGELHEIGTLAASVLAAEAGLGALYLGTNVPPSDVVSAASRVGAAAVVLGWTGAREDVATEARAAIVRIGRELAPPIELWVGGPGARDAARATGGRAIRLESFDAFETALARFARDGE